MQCGRGAGPHRRRSRRRRRDVPFQKSLRLDMEVAPLIITRTRSAARSWGAAAACGARGRGQRPLDGQPQAELACTAHARPRDRNDPPSWLRRSRSSRAPRLVPPDADQARRSILETELRVSATVATSKLTACWKIGFALRCRRRVSRKLKGKRAGLGLCVRHSVVCSDLHL